jgi:phosphopantetheinyl transferase
MDLKYLYRHRDPKRLPNLAVSGKSDQDRKDEGFPTCQKRGNIQLNMALPRLRVKNRKGVSSEAIAALQTTQPSTDRLVSGKQGSRKSPLSHVMHEYLKTMDSYLAHQQEITAIICGAKSKGQEAESTIAISRQLWTAPIDLLPDSTGFYSCLCQETAGNFEAEYLAGLILNQVEMKTWQYLSGKHGRKRQWLLGRMAAKDATHLLLKDRYGVNIPLYNIVVSADRNGQPAASAPLKKDLNCRVCLSISHTGKTAAAVAAESRKTCQGVGFDMEETDQNHAGIEDVGFTDAERAMVGIVSNSLRQAWFVRLWCAKEAVGKALGRGLMGNPLNFILRHVDFQTGIAEMEIAKELAKAFPLLIGCSLRAYTGCDQQRVFGICVRD